VDQDAVLVDRVVGVAADVRAAVDHERPEPAFLGQLARADRAGEAGADDQHVRTRTVAGASTRGELQGGHGPVIGRDVRRSSPSVRLLVACDGHPHQQLAVAGLHPEPRHRRQHQHRVSGRRAAGVGLHQRQRDRPGASHRSEASL